MRAILTYHSVDSSGSPISVDRETFRRHVTWLADGPLAVTDVDTLLGMPDDADAAAITFDDGYRNFLTEAWPLLRERGLPVTLFVVAGRVGGDNGWGARRETDMPRLELLNWDELARLADEGVTLGSHGLDHPRLTGRDRDDVRRELADSRREIRERTGRDPRGFAYPYGAVDDFCRHVAAAHYDWACTTSLAPLDEDVRSFALPRLDMYYFRKPGSLEAWGSRPFTWRLGLRRAGRRLRAVTTEDRPTRRREGREAPGPPAPVPATRGSASEPRTPARPDPAAGGSEPPAGEVRPEISVIVPAHRAAEDLHESLSALLSSDLERHRWELIVVNDGADPETESVARRYADEVIALRQKPRGPAYARNRGAAAARGEILVFVDADVRVHPDTLRRLAEVLTERPDLAAVFGSYDDRPSAAGHVSAYRNLLHHHVHQENAGEAETFWAGCGAVRADVFREVGGYDEWHFSRPQIEDIELGRRIRLRGHGILLRPDIQATHLKSWSLAGVIRTDLLGRGIPWMRLVLHEGDGEGRRVLNLSASHRYCVVATGLSTGGAAVSLVFGPTWLLVASLAGLLSVLGLNADFYDLVRRRKGWLCGLCAVPLHLVHYLTSGFSAVAGWLAYVTVGAPPPPADAAAFREVGTEVAEPLPSPPTESVWYRYD